MRGNRLYIEFATASPFGPLLSFVEQERHNPAAREILGNYRGAGVGAASQPLIPTRRTIFVADAHRRDGQRFIVRADEELTAFLKVGSERGGRAHRELAISWLDPWSRSHPGKLP